MFANSTSREWLCRASQLVAEKLRVSSFRGTPRAEESLFLRAFNPGEIPRFARNDNQWKLFRNYFKRTFPTF